VETWTSCVWMCSTPNRNRRTAEHMGAFSTAATQSSDTESVLYAGRNLPMDFLHEQSVESFLSNVDDSVWRCTDDCHQTLEQPELSLIHLAQSTTTTTTPHTHPLNGRLSGTTRVCRYQKGKTNLDFTEARESDWQWHQLGHMQVCTSLQTDNHISTPPLSFLQAGCPSCRPTNSVEAMKDTYNNAAMTSYSNTSLCSATYVCWQCGTAHIAHRCCSCNQSITHACQAHSSKLAAAGLPLWVHVGTNRRMDTDHALHRYYAGSAEHQNPKLRSKSRHQGGKTIFQTEPRKLGIRLNSDNNIIANNVTVYAALRKAEIIWF